MKISSVNRQRFLRELNEDRIVEAEESLKEMLGAESLAGRRFLDAGSGSGLFSLAARRLGAQVHSFDYDPQSVACTQELKRRYFANDAGWCIQEGSVLNQDFLAGLGQFDVVYSWGVLHHTGSMWQALANIVPLVAAGGRLYISIYNDQGLLNEYWRFVKRIYARFDLRRWLILLIHAPYMWGLRWLARSLPGRKRTVRGTSLWLYTLDLFEGYPFEVARPETIVQFFWRKGFLLEKVIFCGSRHACNEFVFVKDEQHEKDAVEKM
jgi:2-polyprenyl-3-methyl-5-hydroxy-6-metoxy-1,4-benzoquinol methylase